MKIRNGFVSNSSSSSFAIFGAIFPLNEVMNAIKAKVKNSKDFNCAFDIDSDDCGDGNDDLIAKYFLSFYGEQHDAEYVCSHSDNQLYVGRHPDSIRDEETGKSFRESSAKIAENLEDDLGVECHGSGFFYGEIYD